MSRSDRKYINEHNTFICEKCSRSVAAALSGTLNRNHCPECLWSRHVDLRTGDRMSVCKGAMEPIGIWVKDDGEWAIIHRCVKCGFIRSNRIAGDDNHTKLIQLATKPVKMFPFPYNATACEVIEVIMAEATK